MVLDRTHRFLVDRDGRIPGAPRSSELIEGVKSWARGSLGMELPAPAGLPTRDGDIRGFLFFVEPASQGSWIPLAQARRTLPPEDFETFWSIYRDGALGGWEPPRRDLDVFHFGNTPVMAATLAHLVVKGAKRTTSGLLASLEKAGLTIPYPGLLSLVTDYFGVPHCVIETLEVRRVPFRLVAEDVASGEGEGDRTLEDWKRGHRNYFEAESKSLGVAFDDDSPVVNEFFRVIKVLGSADA